MNAAGTATSGIGQPVRRKEDARLLTGAGRFADDLVLPGMAHAVIVRSPYAHARIVSIETVAAMHAPDVLGVLTGADYIADGLGPIPHNAGVLAAPDLAVRLPNAAPVTTPHWPLPPDVVRFAGEPIAMVVAETAAAARDAAEKLGITYEPLPAVTRAADAVKPGAPRLWGEAPGNVCIEIEAGDAVETAAAFARAAHVVRLETWVQRVTGVPMEPRTTAAEYNTGHYTLYTGSGRGVVKVKLDLAQMLRVPEQHVRCVCGEMGGNFGTRNFFYPEYALLPWAARRLGRPVKWTGDRSDSFLSDYQGRDLVVEAELALDADGNFLAVRSSNLSNLGAYAASFVSLQKGLGLLSGVYRIPTGYARGRGAVTNTAPTTPYRSAGRPEVIFVIERLIDLAADRLGIDPAALRRRNMIPPEAQPYRNPFGLTYDSGNYPDVMDRALTLADWRGFPARRAEARRRGKWRGIGVANYVEITSGTPRERAEITVLPDGRVELVMGTMSSGQGHETSFAQLVTEFLGVPFDSIDYVAHDTARVTAGGGSHSGRSMKLGAPIIANAAAAVIDKGRRIASILLQAGEADIEFAQGRYRVVHLSRPAGERLPSGHDPRVGSRSDPGEGVAAPDREIDLFQIAAAAMREDLPDDLRGPLCGICDESRPVASFPYGAQVCEVEVDAETGVVDIVAYAAVDDVGRAINPMILHGQTHGGIAQGAGQALLEACHHDRASGQMLSASLMDYALPRADMLPPLLTELSEVPSPTNPLGVRSGGEGGTTPALAVVINAIVDALRELGVRHVKMPATPERVWRAIRDARGPIGSPGSPSSD